MKKLNWMGVALLVFTLIGCGIGKAQGTGDSFSSLNLSGLSDNGVLQLGGTNIASFDTFSESELNALVDVLDATPTVSMSDLPTNRWGNVMGGTYWSLAQPGMPPLPSDTISADVWPMADGSYLLNDLGFDYSGISGSPMGMHTMDDPIPGGTNDGGAYPDDGPSYTPPSYGTNLWIAQWNLGGNTATGIASNTLADVEYEMQWATNLTQTNWTSLGFIYGSEITNWTALIPQSVAMTNNGFLRLRSWQSSDGSGLPTWWELEYFGTNDVDPNADPAGDGWSNIQKFQNGWNPFVFYTPAAPQGVTVTYNAINGTAVVSWLPSPGMVTNYTVTDVYGNTNNVSAGTTTTTFNVASLTPFNLAQAGPNVYDAFQVQGNYVGGNSAVSAWVYLQFQYYGFTAPLNLIPGSNGSAYLAVSISALPPGTTGVRLTRIDQYDAEIYQDSSVLTNYDIPLSAFTNGLYEIPAAWQVEPVDAWQQSQYEWWGVSLNADDSPNSQSILLSSGYNFDDETDGAVDGWMEPPPLDGRVQMKQNLIFQLRSAMVNLPFEFTQDTSDNSDAITFATNYAYAGFFEYDDYHDGAFDAFLPFENNYLYRNFVFSLPDVNTNGLLLSTTFASIAAGDLDISVPAPYEFVPPSSGESVTPLLDTNTARWIGAGLTCSFDGVMDSLFEVALQPTNTGQGATESMEDGVRNIYGLPFLTTEMAWGNTSSQTATLQPGDVSPSLGYAYSEVAQPTFNAIGYDFWVPNNGADLVPGQAGFSTTNASDNLMIVPVGGSIQVAGYEKLALNNGYANVYGYLGQYFDEAYQVDRSGNVTTTNTGILSPYGDFTATQPGEAALVTMPDVDTGVQGTCTVYSVSLNVDKNHDGTMDTTFNGSDATSANSPYVFWCNNNFDRWNTAVTPAYTETEQDDLLGAGCPYIPNVTTPDCNYSNTLDGVYGFRAIPCVRDLEDFSRLWVCGVTSNLLAALPTNSTVILSWGDVGNPNPNNPTIDLFIAADPDGGIGYLTNAAIATNQANSANGSLGTSYIGRLGPGQSIQLNVTRYFQTGNWLGSYYIWCGVSNGTGGLTLTIADGNGHPLAATTAYIQIEDIKQMYERWTVGEISSLAPNTIPEMSTEEPTFSYSTPTDTNTPYILLVHGYNMPVWAKDRYAETAYKRLYWQGYQGRFGGFHWPTGTALHFGNSELQSWYSARGLLYLLTQLNAEYPGNVYLMAHSLGNVAAGEALRLAGTNQVVNAYVAMQAAVTAHAYDPSTPEYIPANDSGEPDCYAYYWTNGAPCYFNASSGAGTYINFFNTNDWALSLAWLSFENLKPKLAPTYKFYPPDLYYNVLTELFFPTNTYVIFANIIQARSYALGAQPNVGGVFSTPRQVNLPSVWPPDAEGYTAHLWHSAEFRSDNSQRWLFWDTALVQMRLKNNL